MRLDEITDIETLRNLAKTCRAKLIKDAYAEDGTGYLFKAKEWYLVTQDDYGFTLYSEDDIEATVDFSYEEAKRYLAMS